MNMCENNEDQNNELLELKRKYEDILAADPASKCFPQLADVLCRLGNLDKAIGVLVRGLEHSKNNITARFMLGKIYYDQWLIDQAKKQIEIVLDATPDNVEAAKLLSQIYRSEEDFDKALGALEGAYVFHREDGGLASEIQEINLLLNEKENEKSGSVFETPVNSRKVHEVKEDESIGETEVYTETMLSVYVQQGQYDLAREIIDKIYPDEVQRRMAIEKLEKTKLNNMNSFAGFKAGD